MSVPGRRQERLAEQVRDEIAEILAVGELQDPRIGFTTITRVELTADLAHARILVSVLGDDEAQQNTMEGLSSAARYIRREVTHRLKLRRAPELTFVLDHGPEEGLRIEGLLQKLRQEGEK
jgi:ribosome-binding factor A